MEGVHVTSNVFISAMHTPLVYIVIY